MEKPYQALVEDRIFFGGKGIRTGKNVGRG